MHVIIMAIWLSPKSQNRTLFSFEPREGEAPFLWPKQGIQSYFIWLVYDESTMIASACSSLNCDFQEPDYPGYIQFINQVKRDGVPSISVRFTQKEVLFVYAGLVPFRFDVVFLPKHLNLILERLGPSLGRSSICDFRTARAQSMHV